ncbi:MAG: hypothetical protein LBH31_00390 [Burkholderiaceae bacterium]|jgi:hypothetical protein|nr:hypothetical protein [Burkholderiaceae bacterium]
MTVQSRFSVVEQRSAAWWHYPHVWLVIGLLMFAIIASFGLLYAAIRISYVDTLYDDPHFPQDGSVHVTQPNLLPAEEARNNAATGGVGAKSLEAAPASHNHHQSSSYAPADD